MKNTIYLSNHTTILLTNSFTAYPSYQLYILRHNTHNHQTKPKELARYIIFYLIVCLPFFFRLLIRLLSRPLSAPHHSQAKPSQSRHHKPRRQQAICYLKAI
ncbi:uncharacterized protein K452DRAFT_95647 [Aplosporella prunicola CBS 121167]|uniref:Uncharacterized protein n=1 Tax=Aplosporella prunicola CBS 121167 TaxID=1176127 RepID=A0A6A6B4E4_9PEZI|nr:uncharacterized protein K452DRAFT_95647 [Aplosporella prunicola CBS 121167]KAF2138135.1 hypothetical protein K452DRAFT_95647 [Aplosporella prunicola CBS 121167]